jgi:hypothetical protein
VPAIDDAPLQLRSEGLDWRDFEGEIVALDLREAEYFAVNRSGAVLWQAVAQGATRQQLTALIVERFGLGEEKAAADVERFVADLERRGLLERAV